MIIFLVLVVIVLAAVGAAGFLFYAWKREVAEARAVASVAGNVPEKDQAVAPVVAADDREQEARQLREELKLIRDKAVMQAQNSLEAINKLQQENDRLRQEAERLQAEGLSLRIEQEQLQHIRAENAAFKSQVEAASSDVQRLTEDLRKANEAAALLETENAQLRSAGQSSQKQAEEIDAVRKEYQEQADSFRRELDDLRRDNDSMKASQALQSEKIEAHASLGAGAVDAIKEDLEAQNKEQQSLEERVSELEQLNKAHQEKNRMLQYELTKSRAQSVGLERVAEGSAKRFEDFSQEIQRAGQDNAALKNQAESLEQVLNEFKKINADLLRREKLAQMDRERAAQ